MADEGEAFLIELAAATLVRSSVEDGELRPHCHGRDKIDETSHKIPLDSLA